MAILDPADSRESEYIMRSDFQKLLCECYKEGRAWASSSSSVRQHLKRMDADEETRTSTTINPSKLRKQEKGFGENLAPLKRFINKQIGRPWNKVYSEICQHNSKAGAVGLHIFQHLFAYIETNTEKYEHGRIYTKAGDTTHWNWARYEISHGTLYVDPNDNIIKRYKKNKKQPQPKTETKSINVDADTSIENIDGIWYRITWSATPRAQRLHQTRHGQRMRYQAVYCLWQKKTVSYSEAKSYASGKQQLNQRELKQYKLSNQQ